MISPILFDIYAEEIIETIESELNIASQDILFYADDLAVICPNNKLIDLIKTIERTSAKLSLILNKKKCGIMPIFRKRHYNGNHSQEVEGIPITNCYRYLGVELNQTLEITEYLNRIKRKADFIQARTFAFCKAAKHPENRRFLWVAWLDHFSTMSHRSLKTKRLTPEANTVHY
jgi:hypothetical protein